MNGTTWPWNAKRIKTCTCLLIGAAMVMALGLAGCGGGGGGSSSGTPEVSSPATAGLALPTEISAISADNQKSSLAAGMAVQMRAMAAAVSDLPADSDYKQTVTARFVDEPTLEVFGIIETILKAVNQTHYAAAENVGAGPYKSMVAWYDEMGGQSVKELEEWITMSTVAEIDGETVNTVHIWVAEEDGVVKAELKIYQEPSQDANGNYLNYGIWTMTADFGEGDFFIGQADIDAQGMTVLSVNMQESADEMPAGMKMTMKGIVHKSATAGYGLIQLPDWEYCFRPENDCSALTEVPAADITYSYNQDYIGLSKNGAILYKDRNDSVAMTYRYGLFDATTGADVTKSMSFGFPVRYTDSETGANSHGYYGAWQGRHQLWAGQRGTVAEGTTVTREDLPPDQTAPTYRVETYQGTLTKRSLVAASLAQIEGIPVEIWLSDHFDLQYDSTLEGWQKCNWEITGQDPDFGHDLWEQNCGTAAFDLTPLIADEDHRKWVDAGREVCENYETRQGCTFHNYTYNGTAFVESERSSSPGTLYGPADWQDGDRLWINVGGSTYITYTGDFTGDATGWVEKTLESFDDQTWTPVFADGADMTFDFPRDREYYINNKGANFVVKRTGSADAAGDYLVQMETQTVVRPDNISSVLPAGAAYFAMEWEDASNRSTFSFDPSTLLLKYLSVGGNDANAEAGAIVTQGKWGVIAFDAADERITDGQGNPIQFNWEYASQDNPWGALTYLVKTDGSGAILYLDDPIMLDPITLTTLGGDSIAFSLQYDGWMHGLPDMHWELEKNDFQISDAIKNKVVNITEGTAVTESGSGTSYLIKPLEVGIILPTVTGDEITGAGGTLPDLTQSGSLNLDDLPAFTGNGVGPMPTDVTLKYIEGKAIVAKQ